MFSIRAAYFVSGQSVAIKMLSLNTWPLFPTVHPTRGTLQERL